MAWRKRTGTRPANAARAMCIIVRAALAEKDNA
jgi:hypothetical protein